MLQKNTSKICSAFYPIKNTFVHFIGFYPDLPIKITNNLQTNYF